MFKGRSTENGLCKLEACSFDSRSARAVRLFWVLVAFLALIAVASVLPAPANADEGWVIKSFDVAYTILDDGSVEVVEDIQVDFGGLEKHGIFRDITVEQAYDGPCSTCEAGADYHREYKISIAGVADGADRGRPDGQSREGSP